MIEIVQQADEVSATQGGHRLSRDRRRPHHAERTQGSGGEAGSGEVS